jgi:hypothetical protein
VLFRTSQCVINMAVGNIPSYSHHTWTYSSKTSAIVTKPVTTLKQYYSTSYCFTSFMYYLYSVPVRVGMLTEYPKRRDNLGDRSVKEWTRLKLVFLEKMGLWFGVDSSGSRHFASQLRISHSSLSSTKMTNILISMSIRLTLSSVYLPSFGMSN